MDINKIHQMAIADKFNWQRNVMNDESKTKLLRHFSHQIPSLRFKSGGSLSVQASSDHYCMPKIDLGWPYASFEVYCVDLKDEKSRKLLDAFTYEDDFGPSPLPCVPAEIINLIIELEGGIDYE